MVGFLRYEFGLYLERLIHGRAYFRNFMVTNQMILIAGDKAD